MTGGELDERPTGGGEVSQRASGSSGRRARTRAAKPDVWACVHAMRAGKRILRAFAPGEESVKIEVGDG